MKMSLVSGTIDVTTGNVVCVSHTNLKEVLYLAWQLQRESYLGKGKTGDIVTIIAKHIICSILSKLELN